jgi:hypothetical protein
MAKKKGSVKGSAKEAASSGAAVRDRVRELSVRALRDRDLSLKEVPKVVNEVLDGAIAGIDRSIPAGRNVLREVFDGLSEGVHAVASAGSATFSDVRARGKAIAGKSAPSAAKRIRAANDEFLAAVKSFAGKTSKEVREELDTLVERARRTGSKVSGSAQRAASAADGRVGELAGETARAGWRAARSAAGALAMGAGGFLEGLAEAITPSTPATSKAQLGKKKSSAKKTSKKAAPRRKKKT